MYLGSFLQNNINRTWFKKQIVFKLPMMLIMSTTNDSKKLILVYSIIRKKYKFI